MKTRHDITYLLLMALGLVVGVLSTVYIVYDSIIQVTAMVFICIAMLITIIILRRADNGLKVAFLFILLLITGYLVSCILFNACMGRVQAEKVTSAGVEEGIAVLLLSPGEIKEYDPHAAVYKLRICKEAGISNVRWWSIATHVRAVKRDMKRMGDNPFPEVNQRLYNKLCEHLGSKYRVYNANLFGPPYIETVVAEVLKDGYRRIVVLDNLLIQQPYKDIIDRKIHDAAGSHPEVEITHTFPLWNHDGLVSLYECGIIGKIQETKPDDVGIILVARGSSKQALARFEEAYKREKVFMGKIKESMIKNGYNSRKIMTAYLRYGEPSLEGAVEYLLDSGVAKLVVAAAGFENPSIETECHIPRRLRRIKLPAEVEMEYIGPWGDSDVLVKALGDRLEMIDR